MASSFLHTMASATINQHFTDNPLKNNSDNIVSHCAREYSALVHHTAYGIIILVIWVLMFLFMAFTGGFSNTTMKYTFFIIGLMGLFLVGSGIYHGILTPETFAVSCATNYLENPSETSGGCSTCASGGCQSCSGGSASGGCSSCVSGGCPSCSGGCPTCSGGFTNPLQLIGNVKNQISSMKNNVIGAVNKISTMKNEVMEMANSCSTMCPLLPEGPAKVACDSMSQKIQMMNNSIAQLNQVVEPLSQAVTSISGILGM